MGEIRDPIYGLIELGDTEFEIINTPIFQRLRKIRSSVMAYLVYPGANHTRFDHSIGVFHVASLMAKHFFPGNDLPSTEIRRTVRLAALLHDIGHAPFSHTTESVLGKYSDSSDFAKKEKIHEKITMKLIENDENLCKILSGNERKKIVEVLSGNNNKITLMKEIVSGPIDADKIDYLLRDSYFCGVEYGKFDIHRLLNTLTYYEEESDKFIAIKHDGINSLEQFVLAKYYMNKQVYYHKVRTLTDAMIVRGLELGIEKDNISFLKKIFQYKNNEEYFNEFIKYWDDKVINELVFSKKDGFAKEIFKRLYERKLFKRVFSEKQSDIKGYLDDSINDIIIDLSKKENEEIRKRLEKEISSKTCLNCQEEFVIVNLYTIEDIKQMAKNSEEKIIIIDKNNSKKMFSKESVVFNSISESTQEVYFEVYAPVEDLDLKDKQNLSLEILEILKKWKV